MLQPNGKLMGLLFDTVFSSPGPPFGGAAKSIKTTLHHTSTSFVLILPITLSNQGRARSCLCCCKCLAAILKYNS
ncbi:hypothetical protein [Pontibacter rugosus]